MRASIRSISELEAAIEDILLELRDKTNAGAVAFHYYDRIHDRLILPIGVGLQQPRRFKSWLPSMDRVAGKIVRSGNPVVADDAEYHADMAGPFVYAEGVKSSAGFPLITTAGETIGTVFVNYRSIHPFSKQDRAILEQSARKIADTVADWLAKEPNLEAELSALAGHRREEAALQEIATTLRQTLGDTAIAIWILRARNELALVAQSGLQGRATRGARLTRDESSSIIAAFKSEAAMKGSVLEDGVFTKEQAAAMRLNTLWAVPILSQSRSLGVLCVYPIGYDDLTPREETVVSAFAKQIAATVENHRRILTLTTLHDIGGRLNLALEDSQQLMEEIVVSAARVMDADSAAIHQYDSTSAEFYPFERSVAHGLKPYPPSEKPRTGGVSEYIVEHGILPVPDINEEDPTLVRTSNVTASGVRSYIGIRLKVADEIVGVLFINYNEPRVFSPDDLTIAATFASYAATAIHNSRLYAKSLERAARLDLIGRVAAAISSTLDLDEILQLAVDGLAEVFNVKQCAVVMFDEAREYGEVSAEYLEAGCISATRFRLPLRDNPQMKIILETKKPLVVDDVQHDPSMEKIRDIMKQRRTLSMIIVPIVLDDEVVGTIGIDAIDEQRRFSGEDAELAQVVADQVAAAIKNAQSYQRRQVLNEVGRALTSGIRLRENAILELIHSQASELMDTDNMYVAMYDEALNTVRFPLVFIDGTQKKVETREAGKGRTEEIIRSRKAILISTETEARAWYEEKPGRVDYLRDEEGKSVPMLPSWLGVPMIAGERVLGVIATFHPAREYVYDADDLEILQALANQAAIAVDNAKLYYDINLRLKSLTEVGQLLTSSINMPESDILDLLHIQASELMDTDNMYIALYEPDPDQPDEYDSQDPSKSKIYGSVHFGLAYVDGDRIDIATKPGYQPRKAGKGKTEEIIRTREPLVHETKAEAEKWYAQPEHDEYVGAALPSWLGVPMIVGERVLGVVATYHPTREFVYGSDDLEILRALANQAAVALNNARLLEETQRRTEQLTITQEITSAIQLHDTLPAFLQSILELTLPRMEAEAGTIQLLDEPSLELAVRAAIGPISAEEFERIPVAHGITGQAASKKRTIYEPDISKSDVYLPYLAGTRSELATPLMVGDEVIGVFNLEDPRPQAFDKQKRELFQLICAQVAIAIQQKLRLEREQRRRTEAEKDAMLSKLTRDIAHHMKNKVGLVRLAALNLQNDPAITQFPERRKEVEKILRNAESAGKLARDLFEPFRETDPEEVDVSWLLEEALNLVGEQDGVEIVDAVPPGLPKVLIERQGTVNVFQELVVNGLKAVRRREGLRRIEISGGISVDQCVELRFSNTGPLLPEERWDAIFEQFTTFDSDVDEESFGLGLWAARAFLRRQGGDIQVLESNDAKTTFIVRLPTSNQGGER